MILTQYYLGCLSHGSYLIGDESTGRAIVVDPRRDITDYLADAERHQLTIEGVINTHVHADFVAGHLELAAATGAWIGYGPTAAERAEFEVRTLTQGDRISLGEVELEVLHTPGHTWESISVVVRERPDAAPHAVLTGDSLFIGGVGRPDLVVSEGSTSADLAAAMYRTLHEVLFALPDSTLVYPAHGAGSSCGKGLSDELDSTIGAQKATNAFAQPMPEADFIAMVTTGQPAAPAYFAVDAALNLRRRDLLAPGAAVVPFSPAEVLATIDGGVTVVDTRTPEEFAAGHLVGAVNIGIDGRFAESAGMVVDPEAEILIVASDDRHDEAALRLGRIGFDRVVGYVEDFEATRAALPDLMRTVERMDVEAFDDLGDDALVIDIRNAGEREDGAVIPGALHLPLAELARRHAEIDPGRRVVLHCASGWRSSVGASLLRSLGHDDVTDLLGGFNAWAEQHRVSA